MQVIFNDAVVHDGEVSRLIDMGMGVLLVGLTVRRPARMPDADGVLRTFARHHFLKPGKLALFLIEGHSPIVKIRDPRAVVAAVLEFLQTADQNRDNVPIPYISNYSAHNTSPVFTD